MTSSSSGPADRPASRQQAQRELIERELGGIGVSFRSPNGPAGGDVDHLYREGSILVRDEDLARVSAVVGGEVQDTLINGVTLYAPRVSTDAALTAVRDALGVGVATPDHVLSICPVSFCPATEPEEVVLGAEPDPGVSTAGCDGRGICASVVDTGWLPAAAAEHSWLAGVEGDEEQPFDADGRLLPYAGHGAFVAGVLRCMAPQAHVYVEGAMPRAGAVHESDVVRQLDEALDKSPDLICLSAGTRTRNNLPLLGFEVFWRTRLSHYKGVALVAAAGNDGDRGPFWPAAFPWAVSVGALSANWRGRAGFSNYGRWVDVFAPGEGLVNAYATGPYTCQEPPHAGELRQFAGMARWSGTSFSTPLVAGLIAARMSATGENAAAAAASLLTLARRQAVPGLGAVLLPGQACGDEQAPSPHCSCGGHRACC